MKPNAFENLMLLAVRSGNTKDLFFALFEGTEENYETFIMQTFVNRVLAEQKEAADKAAAAKVESDKKVD